PLFFFSSRRRHTRFSRDWSSDVCSSDLIPTRNIEAAVERVRHVEREVRYQLAIEADDDFVVVVGRVIRRDLLRRRHRRTRVRDRSEERRVGKECGVWGWPAE